MIIGKTTGGKYLTDRGIKIESKQEYEKQLTEQQAITKPDDKELIELGKQQHPFYHKDIAIINIQNQIQEINDYEKKKDKITIDDSKIKG